MESFVRSGLNLESEMSHFIFFFKNYLAGALLSQSGFLVREFMIIWQLKLKELTIHKDEWTNTDYQYASLVN
jgi:hypothetical protein